MESLKNAIKNTAAIPDRILHEFASCWERIKLEKGTCLSLPNKVDKFLYFNIQGVQKAYYVNDGKINIISFTREDRFTCIPESFLTQTPSRYYLECLTDSVFYRIAYEDFISQINKHAPLQSFLINSLMNLVNNINQRFLSQACLSIEEKFKDFMRDRAHLINIVPHKDIANYLNMNPTNFSKLLNKVIIE